MLERTIRTWAASAEGHTEEYKFSFFAMGPDDGQSIEFWLQCFQKGNNKLLFETNTKALNLDGQEPVLLAWSIDPEWAKLPVCLARNGVIFIGERIWHAIRQSIKHRPDLTGIDRVWDILDRLSGDLTAHKLTAATLAQLAECLLEISS